MATQIKLSKRLGSENIPSTEEAEAIVKEWAANMNRCVSEPEVDCLVDYLKNNCKAGVEDFDKVLFGWYRRGESENRIVADAIHGLVNSNRESIEKLLSGFENSQTKIVSIVGKAMEKAPPSSAPPSMLATATLCPRQPRKWPLSLRPLESEYGVLSRHLNSNSNSKTSEDSMKISDIFEDLIAIHKLNRTDRVTHEFWSMAHEFPSIFLGTLDDFLGICKLTMEDLVPFTPHRKTQKVMNKFVEDLSFVSRRSVADLIAELSVYLSYFNNGK